MNRVKALLDALGVMASRAGVENPAALTAMRANVARDLPAIRAAAVDTGGFTYDPVAGVFRTPRAAGAGSYDPGYAVSINPREQEILLGSPGQLDEAELMQAYDDLVASGTMRPGVNFGGFFSDESQRYAVDPSELISSRRRAMRRARSLDQEGIFDMGAPTWDEANIRTEDLRREFRRRDAGAAAALAALAAMIGRED